MEKIMYWGHCEDCKYYNVGIDTEEHGYCMRFPPVPDITTILEAVQGSTIYDKDPVNFWEHPVVFKWNVCGEYIAYETDPEFVEQHNS